MKAPLLTVAQACERLGVKPSTLYRLAEDHQIPYVDVASRVESGGGRGTKGRAQLRFLESDLDDFIARRRVAVTSNEEPRKHQKADVLALPGADRYTRGAQA